MSVLVLYGLKCQDSKISEVEEGNGPNWKPFAEMGHRPIAQQNSDCKFSVMEIQIMQPFQFQNFSTKKKNSKFSYEFYKS